jgi:metallo-beta-lactamase family protein
VKIHGGWVDVRAEVARIENLSAHADQEELIAWVATMEHRPRHIFLVHGEPAAADALRVRIVDRLGIPCTVPQQDDRVRLE